MNDLVLQKQITDSVNAAVQNYVKNLDLDMLIQQNLEKELNRISTVVVRNAYDKITENRDIGKEMAAWVNSTISQQLLSSARVTITNEIQALNLKNLATDLLNQQIDKKLGMLNFAEKSISSTSINWQNTVPASVVSGKHQNFLSTGIQDIATETRLVITDQACVISELVSKNVMIEQDAFVKNLEVDGELKLGTKAVNTLTQLAETVFDLKQSQQSPGLELAGAAITNQGKTLLDHKTLGTSITDSNLRKVGNLLNLSVMGDTNLADVLYVSASGRTSINSPESTGALSVWDQDAEFTLVKRGQKTMFAGSTRAIDIVLGSHDQNQITLKSQGEVAINNKLRFMGRLISVSDNIPEHTGEPGELVITHTSVYMYSKNSWQKIV